MSNNTYLLTTAAPGKPRYGKDTVGGGLFCSRVEMNVQPDRGGITAFQGSTSYQPPRQVNGVTQPQRGQP
jgi:hypothetical protein